MGQEISSENYNTVYLTESAANITGRNAGVRELYPDAYAIREGGKIRLGNVHFENTINPQKGVTCDTSRIITMAHPNDFTDVEWLALNLRLLSVNFNGIFIHCHKEEQAYYVYTYDGYAQLRTRGLDDNNLV